LRPFTESVTIDVKMKAPNATTKNQSRGLAAIGVPLTFSVTVAFRMAAQ
jgi:hypothetical protein